MLELLHSPFSLLLVQAVIIISASRLLGLGARRLGQPLVVAEVAAGILLGPSLLGWLAPEAAATLFPPSSLGGLHLISQVGLVLFMFLIGLELDPRLLRGRGHASVVISHTSIIVPFGLGALLAIHLYPKVSDPSVPFSSFTLFMGVAMSITAFPVLARILTERRMLRSKVGSVTIACAAVDDVTAWCLLAFVVSIVRAQGLTTAIWTTAQALAYVLVMMFGVRPFLARLSARSAGADGVPQNAVALTFIVLFVSSATTEAIGIHGLFGAFMLGAILPRESGFARAIAEKLEDVVVVFMLPLFFAFSGLRTQIGLLDDVESWAMTGLIILIACAGKFGGSFVAARLTGSSWREAGAIGILMNTRGLMELIVLNIGLDLGVISPTLFTMMVLMALATTFMTTPLLHLLYPNRALAADGVEPREPEVPRVAAPGFTVLACLANPASWPNMAQLAASLARVPGASAQVYALRLLSPPERTSVYLKRDEPVAPEPLEPVLGALGARGVEARPLSFVSADPGEDICRVADVKQPDLVVIGSHTPLLGGTVLGGVVHEVLTGAPSDVAVFVDRGLAEVRRILLPYRGSLHDRLALELGRRLALGVGAQVTVLDVAPRDANDTSTMNVQREVERTFREAPAGQVLLKRIESDEPADAVAEEARRGYDLVVVGIGRRWGIAEPRAGHLLQLGLFPQRLVQDCETSLLIVRHAPRARARSEDRALELEAARAGHADPSRAEA